MDCPFTSAHNYEGIVDVHGTNDVVHVNGGDNNTIAQDKFIQSMVCYIPPKSLKHIVGFMPE